MEAVQKTIDDLATVFKSDMDDFHRDLQKATTNFTTASPTTRIATDFENFRKFIQSSFQNLQAQVELLAKLHDKEEMRSRRKMLLVHGVVEESIEDTASILIKIVTNHLKVSNIDLLSIKRCHRIGLVKGDIPRPILVKFQDIRLRDNILHEKSQLKGSGITISEFLNKGRHEVFMAARRAFGISNCWTRNGTIFISAPDGSRHRITSMTELKSIPAPATTSVPAEANNPVEIANQYAPKEYKRPKRILKGR